MSTMLNLADRLLAMGRRFQELGRERDALHLLSRLATFRELSAEIAEETQVRLAEIQLRRRRYRQARRHLTAALQYCPGSARYHHLMATAADRDPRGNSERAREHYRRSLELDPNQPRCLAELGLLCVRLGEWDEGIEHLQRAAGLAPDDPEVIGKLATGLRLAGRPGEARDVLRAALFRNPRDGRFRTLWNDFQFQQLRRQQEEARRGARRDAAEAEGPVLLPFVRPVPPERSVRVGGRTIRLDGPGGNPPHFRQPARLPDQRSAQ